MSEQFLGEIRAFSFGFPPKGWALCNGQLLPIVQNQALFALLGTTYGGDGRITFGLPNLQGRIAAHTGNGFSQGQQVGEAAHTLSLQEMPGHTHSLNGFTSPQTPTNVPDGTTLLTAATTDQTGTPQVQIYAPPGTTVVAQNTGTSGGSQPHQNMMPFLTMSYCIALTGIFPSRN